MASPIGHALGGLVACSLDKHKVDWLPLVLALVLAELPDIDFLFGFVTNEPNKYHHGFTHSFAFVIIAGLLTAALAAWKNRSRFKRYAFLFTGAGISHIVLDLLAKDTTPPYGAPVFWPFSEKYFLSPVIVLSDMHRASNSSDFFASLFTMHNFMSVTREVVILVPVILIFYFMNKKRLAQ